MLKLFVIIDCLGAMEYIGYHRMHMHLGDSSKYTPMLRPSLTAKKTIYSLNTTINLLAASVIENKSFLASGTLRFKFLSD